MKLGRLFCFFVLGSVCLAPPSASAFERTSVYEGFPSLITVVSPFARTPHTSLGLALGLGLAPYSFETFEGDILVDASFWINFPYERKTDADLTDFLFSLGVYYQAFLGGFMGFRGGVAANIGGSGVPVLFGSFSGRWFPYHQLFFETGVGISGAGNHYLQLGVGFVLF